MDRFLVYIMVPGSLTRCFANEKEVKYMLKNGEVTILRSISNQTAHLIDDKVFWQDVEDIPASQAVNE